MAIRVLAVSPGLDRPTTGMLVGLKRAGVEVAVAGHPKEIWTRELESGGVPVERVPIRGRLDLRAIRALRRRLAAERFDILHAFNNHTVGCAIQAARGNDVRVVCFRGYMGHVRRWNPNSWLTYLHPRMARILCASRAVERYFLGIGVPAEKLRTVYKGHDVSWYRDPHADLTAFGIPEGSFVVGFAGRLRPRKGIHVLIEAASLVPADRPIHLLLVGRLERGSRLPAEVERRGLAPRVHFTGFRDDAPRLTGSCDVFALPSLEREGFPRAVVEAMAQEVPALVSDAGGMPELVEHGVTGLVVPQGDAPALADAILRLYRDPTRRSEMGLRARESIRTRFSVERTVEQTVALYRELLSVRGGPS